MIKTFQDGPLWQHLGHHHLPVSLQGGGQWNPCHSVLLHPRDPLKGTYVQGTHAQGGMKYNCQKYLVRFPDFVEWLGNLTQKNYPIVWPSANTIVNIANIVNIVNRHFVILVG